MTDEELQKDAENLSKYTKELLIALTTAHRDWVLSNTDYEQALMRAATHVALSVMARSLGLDANAVGKDAFAALQAYADSVQLSSTSLKDVLAPKANA